MTVTGPHVATCVADLPVEAWDALAGPDDVFLTSRWLRVVEATAGVPFRYLWLERDGIPAVAVVTAMATVDVPWVLGRPDVILRNSVTADLPGAAEFAAALGQPPSRALMPSLVAGGRHLGHTRVLYDGRAGAADVDRLLGAVDDVAAEWRATSIAFPYVDDDDTMLGGILQDRGYESYVSGRYSRLRVPGDGFAGYLARLPRKRRVSVAAERRRIHAANVDVATAPLHDIDAHASLAELECALLARYGIVWEPARAERILGVIQEAFGADAFVVLARAGGRVRGFSLVLKHGDQWYGRQAGFDYDFQRETRLPLYFEVVYYRLVEEAAEAGVHTIHYGLGSETTKRFRGCEVSDQRCWIRRVGGGAA